MKQAKTGRALCGLFTAPRALCALLCMCLLAACTPPGGQSGAPPAEAGQSAPAEAGKSAPAEAGQSAPAEAGQSEPAQSAPAQSEPAAPAGNAVLAQIAASYSTGSYADGAVPRRDIESILQSGARAPSAKNAQPWHFTVVTDESTVRALYRNAAGGTVLIAVSGRRDISTDTLGFDCGLAAAYMQLAAESLGYGARILIEPVAALERDRAGYGIPEGYGVQAAIAVGVPAVDAAAGATARNPLAGMVNYV